MTAWPRQSPPPAARTPSARQDGFTPVDRLRLAAAALRASQDEHLQWLGIGIAIYLTDAPSGMTLDAALGVAVRRGGEPWHKTEARARRDSEIKALAHMVAPGESRCRAAEKVHRELRRYATTRWQRGDERLKECPVFYSGFAAAPLFEIMRASGGEIPERDTIRKILAIK